MAITTEGYLFMLVVVLVWGALAWTRRLPSMSSFKDFADVINTAGGNIILLAVFTAWSIQIAMRLFYSILALPEAQLKKTDVMITFVTGTLVGTFAGALIKTLTGGKANGGGAGKPDTLAVDVAPEK